LTTFIIRNIDERLYKEIKKQAKINSTSMNKFIISIIETEFGFTKKTKKSKKYTDLDNLFSQWSKEEYNLISKNINEQRKIDHELWK